MVFKKKEEQRKEFIKRLQEDYINELQLAQQMRHHAESARYKHYRARLLEIAASEEKQAEKIKSILEQLGGNVPENIPAVKSDGTYNLFEALKRDLEMDMEDYLHYYERLYQAEEEGLTEVLPILNELREDEFRHRETLLELLQKLNPYQT